MSVSVWANVFLTRFLTSFLMGLLIGGMVYLITLTGLFLVEHVDDHGSQTVWHLKGKERKILFLLSIIQGMWIEQLTGLNILQRLLLGIFAGCLSFASVTDWKTCEVFQFTWWVACVVTLLLMGRKILQLHLIKELVVDFILLLFYVVVQELFFCKMYGRADCHAFVACAAAGFAVGMDVRGYFLHMTLAFCILIVVQFMRHNVESFLQLKDSVAFLPYITISFWVTIVFLNRVSIR